MRSSKTPQSTREHHADAARHQDSCDRQSAACVGQRQAEDGDVVEVVANFLTSWRST